MKFLLVPAFALLLSANAQAELKLWGTCNVVDTRVQQLIGVQIVPGCEGNQYQFHRDDEAGEYRFSRISNPGCRYKKFDEQVGKAQFVSLYYLIKAATGTVCK